MADKEVERMLSEADQRKLQAIQDPGTRLTQFQRTVLELKLASKTYAEIADLLGKNHSNVKATHFVAARKVEDMLNPDGIQESLPQAEPVLLPFVPTKEILANKPFTEWLFLTGFASRDPLFKGKELEERRELFRELITGYYLSNAERRALEAYEPGELTTTKIQSTKTGVKPHTITVATGRAIDRLERAGFDMSAVTLPQGPGEINGLGARTQLSKTELLYVFLVPRESTEKAVTAESIARTVLSGQKEKDQDSLQYSTTLTHRVTAKIPAGLNLKRGRTGGLRWVTG